MSLFRLDRVTVRYFRPTQLLQIANDNQVVKSRWNLTSEVDVIHLGLKAAMTSYNYSGDATTVGRIKVYTTFYLAFRTPK